MKLLLSTTNALNKWLKSDLPRCPAKEGQRVGVNFLASDEQSLCWQLHIIDNAYKSRDKTIIACEANSRFIVFIPVDIKLTLDELATRLQMEWQYSLAETLQQLRAMSNSKIAMLLSELSELNMDTHWVKNTDLSISGHISDAGLWVNQTLVDGKQEELSSEQALDLAIYLNSQPKQLNKGKDKIIPVKCLLEYCNKQLGATCSKAPDPADNISELPHASNIVYLKLSKPL
ncbi:amino acid adenylation [Shewanella sp. SG41-4]|uniref:amino acid adenylation n=1 Tax=Shewanella sp. SG41-4 TaxID=2760976 RepID=UPI001602A13C|nr:amino acid adenylation [Shewanella sp. SG41-4]MBB1440552.1 amino acid adenylation [Shewanella sp. SG41-4]